MQFAPEFAQEIESVDILDTNRLTQLAEVVATGVRMLIVPLSSIPQEALETGRQSYRQRFGAVLETPHAEVKARRQIRRADGTLLNVMLVKEAFGTMEIELESEGTP